MIVAARHAVELLVDIAAERHIELLHATADGEQRQATAQGRMDQRQVEQVAVAVLRLFRGQVVLPIQAGVDV